MTSNTNHHGARHFNRESVAIFISLAFFGCMAFLSGCASQGTQKADHQEAIRKIMQEVYASAQKALNPEAMCVIVTEPQTGRILAMKGNAIRFLIEPASLFKPVAMVAGLEKGKITPRTKIDCESGAFPIGKFTLKDHIPFGKLPCDQVLAKSSNIGITKIAMLLEDQDFYDYARKFGFGQKNGIGIPGEIPGILHPPAKWGEQTKPRMAIGQNLAVTPIQIAMAYGALANGGKLMKPILAGERPHSEGRVCSPKTASFVRNALQLNASDAGSSPLAQVEGVPVGGKAGTAQAVNSHGYDPGKYVTMFAGFFPVEHPRYVVVVVIDKADLPPNKNYGGLVAAPIFSEIAKKISLSPNRH